MKKIITLLLVFSIIATTVSCSAKPIEENNVSTSMSIIGEANSQPDEYIDEKPSINDNPTLNEGDAQSSSSKTEQSSTQESSKPVSKPPEVSSSQPTSKLPEVSSSQPTSKLPEVSSSQPTPKLPEISSSQPVEVPKESSTEPPSLPVSSEPTFNNSDKNSGSTSFSQVDEVRAVWISYLDFYTLLQEKSENQFKTNINKAFDNVKNEGFNTVIVQVRPFGDALYKSDYFPWSHIITGTEGVNPGFDPLEIMVDYAHDKGLLIEAWINPYRVRAGNNMPGISSKSPANTLKSTGAVINYNGGIYFNPASTDAINLICNGVGEILHNYDIDGIHFDDYFYPTQDAAFDKSYYNSYVNGGGKLSLADWRRENVNKLVKQVYSTIKKIDSDVQFGISPQANFENNYDKQYIDVEKWLSNKGYVDYICPQVYFGFKNSAYPYSDTVERWNDLITVSGVKLYVGLAPYKIGTEDKWAGSGSKEWITDSNILANMVKEARKNNNYDGFFMYRYDSIFNPASAVKSQISKEMSALEKILD